MLVYVICGRPLNRPYGRAAARFLREVAFRSADRTFDLQEYLLLLGITIYLEYFQIKL